MDVAELMPDLNGLAAATEELRTSAKFKRVLQVILSIGNALNESSFRGGAAGFQMDALIKVCSSIGAGYKC